MDILLTAKFLKEYLSGADKKALQLRYGFPTVPSVIAAKRQQVDRRIDFDYQISPDEKLLPCVGIPFYVSDRGNIFNVLKQRLFTDVFGRGYVRFGYKGRTVLVHRLVMTAFVGESNLMINHIDGDKTNNNVSNLEYCTAKENVRHSIDVLGNKVHGEFNKFSKLTDELVKEIYESYRPRSRELGMEGLAARYGVDFTTIHLIVNGKTWTHVTGGIKKAEKNPMKLSPEAIADIRSNYQFRKTTIKHFAEKYGVCDETIRKVLA